ncbi:MAG: D-alanyl-D-alanine carboxypeptidase family protein [Acutalibacteraceae bacterium]
MKKSNKGVKTVLAVCVLCFAAILVTVVMTMTAGADNSGVPALSPSTLAQPTQDKKTDKASEATTVDEYSKKETENTTAATTETTQKPTESETIPLESYSKKEETTLPVTAAEATKQISSTSSSGRIIVNPDSAQWNLIVVNASREIPEGYVPQLKEILGCGKYLDYRVAPHYEDMYYAAKKDGITLTPYSAYRTYERQKNNYNNLTNQYMSQYGLSREEAAKKAATVILPPGTSEHNLGLAMDICNTYDSFAYTKEYAWLQEHAHEYGFILRYTKEKQSITGIVPEPWHWRYVGVEYAKKIKDSGLCLEEYLDSIGVAY